MDLDLSLQTRSKNFYMKLMASHHWTKRSLVRYLVTYIAVFMKEFDLNQDGKVSWEEFKLSMQRVKDKMNNQAETAKEYTSYNKMIADKAVHKGMNQEV